MLAVHEADRSSGAPVDRLNTFAQVAAACVLLESVWAGHEAHRATGARLLRFGTLANVAALLVLLETVCTEHRTHGSQAALVPNGSSLRLHAFTDVAPVRSFLEPLCAIHSTGWSIGARIDMADSTLANITPAVVLGKSRLAVQRAVDGRTLILLDINFFVAIFAFACLASEGVFLEAERTVHQTGDGFTLGRKALA